MTRRLLLLGGGTGGITLPTPTGSFSMGATGFWNPLAGPAAAYYNGRTHLAWCNDAGDVYAAHWDHASETLSTPVLLVSGQVAVDGAIHVSPAVLVRPSDHKIVVADVANGGTHQPGVWISSAAESSAAFGVGADIGVSGIYTYVDLVLLGTDIYLITAHWSSGSRRLVWYKSTDGGATWGSMVVAIRPAVDSTFFWDVSSNGSRIDFYTTDTDRSSGPSSVYHCYWDGSTLRNSAGTSLGSLAAFSADGTLVQNASLGGAYVESSTYDGGNPAGVMFIDQTTTTLTRRALWTGAAWSVHTVVDQGGIIASNANVAGAAIAFGDADTVYVPVKAGAHFELFRYVTADGGTTWTGTALTAVSAADNASPQMPQDADPSLPVVWGRGTYTSDSDFDFTIYGYSPP